MNNKNFRAALKEASEWHKHATDYELSQIGVAEAKKIVLKRIFEKYKDSNERTKST